jgi:transposase
MDEYIGLDVSLKETAISVRCGGKRIWRGKCASDSQLLAALIRKHAPAVKRVVFETGPLSVWFFHALTWKGCQQSALTPPRQGRTRHGGQQDRRL